MKERFSKMSTFKFEEAIIVRLGETISRLNDIVEKRVVEAFTSRELFRSSDAEIVDYVYHHRDTVNNLVEIRNAKVFFEYGKKADEFSGKNAEISGFVNAAHCVYDILSELSVEDSHMAQCKVTVSPALNIALRKAMRSPLFKREAKKVYDFINLKPSNGWCYTDAYHNTGSKKFKLVKSEKYFEKLLDSEHLDITFIDLCGIRIAYKFETETHLHEEQENIRSALCEVLSCDKNSLLKPISILYPDTLHHGEYIIYIPDIPDEE
ncbi:MAG: hypothetical protein IJN50_01795 [Clostridia bacterium]|nr:hypothetical protein [Clostridia bacterium]